jgi:DNA-binding transcriptional LysR family regulator
MGKTDFRSVDFNLLAAFDAIYEQKQITRAAQQLNLTQSTVSGTLQRLRQLFGNQLFVRGQGGMVPTRRADQLAPQIKRLLADLEVVLAPAVFDPKTAEFTARISANDYGQTVVLLPLINALPRVAPGLRIAVMPFETVELGEKFRIGQIDIAVTIPEMAPQDYPSRFLFSDRYVGVVRHDSAIRWDRIDLDTFCDTGQILVSPTGGAMESAMDSRLRQIGRKRAVMVSVPTFRMALDLARTTDYVAILPERFVPPDDETVRVLELPVDLRGPDAIIVWHPRIHDDPAFKWLCGQIVRCARGEPKEPQ